MADIIYTPGQQFLRQDIKKWFLAGKTRQKPWYSYSGAAGTGKTTVIRAIVEDLNLQHGEYVCAAYTGKAALQLLRNDLPGRTIHSLIYNVWPEHVKVTDEYGDSRTIVKLRISLKEQLDPQLKLIFIDEATMVNDAMRDELLSFGIPIVFVGDMNQLPPIFGISSVMMNPDFVLDQIMRQKEGDPIIQLSQMILHDYPLKLGDYGLSRVLSSMPMDEQILQNYDQIICAKNKTRESINNHVRYELLNRRNADPVMRDKLICRQNDWEMECDGIFLTNGLIGYITDIDRSRSRGGYMTIAFQPDFMDKSFEDVKLDLKYLRLDFTERSGYGISRYQKFEYGWAITCHLSQGSQWPRVLFIDEKFYDRETTKKLRYTAITRAEHSIDIVVDARNESAPMGLIGRYMRGY